MITAQTTAVLKEAFDSLDADKDGALSISDWIRNERPPKLLGREPPGWAAGPLSGQVEPGSPHSPARERGIWKM
jgi:hypothetical protein